MAESQFGSNPMNRTRMTAFVLAALVLPAFVDAQFVSSGSTPSGNYGFGGASRSVDEYCYDDGSADVDIALAAGGELVWIHVFDTLEGLETITHVNSAIGLPGTSVPNTSQLGQPLRVYVWDDPDNDGNPEDAVLLAEAVGTITHVDDDVFNRVALDPPVTVSGKFIIGASVVHPPGEYPGPRDATPGSWGRAWVTGVEGGPFDPHFIAVSCDQVFTDLMIVGMTDHVVQIDVAHDQRSAATGFGHYSAQRINNPSTRRAHGRHHVVGMQMSQTP